MNQLDVHLVEEQEKNKTIEDNFETLRLWDFLTTFFIN